MHLSRSSLSSLLTIAVAVLLFGAGQAHARRRGITIINTGADHSEIGPVKKEYLSDLAPGERAEAMADNYDTVGFQYERFGIFWLDIWNWSGEYIVYNKASDKGGVVTPAQAAMLLGVDEKKLGKPLNYRMPYGLMVLLGLVSLKVVPRILAKRRQAQAVPEFRSTGPQWSPQNPPPGAPGAPPAGGPPPMPPPMPPEQ